MKESEKLCELFKYTLDLCGEAGKESNTALRKWIELSKKCKADSEELYNAWIEYRVASEYRDKLIELKDKIWDMMIEAEKNEKEGEAVC